MYKEYEASGKTLDEALDRVSLLAGRSLDELTIEIIDMPSRGLFGIGQKNARVRASFDMPDLSELEDAPQQAPVSTFGKKKSKREKVEAKAGKTAADIQIQPIVSIEPGQVSPEQLEAELKAQQAQAAAKAAQPVDEAEEERPQWPQRSQRDSRPQRENQAERSERPARAPRPPRPPRENRDNSAPRSPRPERSEGSESRPPRTPRPQRPFRGNRPEQAAGEAAPRRRESHATPVTEGEMAQGLTTLAMDFLNPIFNQLGVAPQPEVSIVDGILWLAFSGDKLGLLIGRRGETLNALQYLTNLAVNKDRNEHIRVVLDVSGYRSSREETLTAMARKMADKAVRTGRRVELEPMNPHERRVVHIALQGDKRVETVSHGEEPYRRVVITSKQRRSRGGRGRARLEELPETSELPLGGGSLEELVPDAPPSNGDDNDAIYALLSNDNEAPLF